MTLDLRVYQDFYTYSKTQLPTIPIHKNTTLEIMNSIIFYGKRNSYHISEVDLVRDSAIYLPEKPESLYIKNSDKYNIVFD